MKVYVITTGEYSDYCICDVAIDEKDAENKRKLHSDKFGKAEIEEYDTERYTTLAQRVANENLQLYRVEIDSTEGCIIKTEKDKFGIFTDNGKENIRKKYRPCVDESDNVIGTEFCGFIYFTLVLAKDAEHARKIAKDRYSQYVYRLVEQGREY